MIKARNYLNKKFSERVIDIMGYIGIPFISILLLALGLHTMKSVSLLFGGVVILLALTIFGICEEILLGED